MTATIDQNPDTARYTGPGRKGINRPLTTEETQRWKAAVARWHTSRPWTEQVLADNATVRALLVHLYEDGVALTELAATAGWGYPQTAGVLRRARAEGIATGSRRYIAPEPKAQPDRQPYRRDLTDPERAALAAHRDRVPRRSNGTLNWATEQATTLLEAIDSHNLGTEAATAPVSLESLAATLGMSRQGLHQHLTRHRQAKDDNA